MKIGNYRKYSVGEKVVVDKLPAVYEGLIAGVIVKYDEKDRIWMKDFEKLGEGTRQGFGIRLENNEECYFREEHIVCRYSEWDGETSGD